MKKLVTVAIPAYNMEKYLGRCLDSMLAARLRDSSVLDILVINDGSKDNTLSIAREYETGNGICIRVIDKPNGGWGSAINVAIENAAGKYFRILDSDDWFDAEAFTGYISLLEEVDADLIATSFTYVYSDGTSREDMYAESLCNRLIPFDDYLVGNGYVKHFPMATLTFRTSLLQENGIRVCDRYYADIDYGLTPLIYVNTVYFSQINLYRYYIGREGQSISLTGYNSHLDDYVRMCKKVVDFYACHREDIREIVQKAYLKDGCNIVRFAYELLMCPLYNQTHQDRKAQLKDLDAFLKAKSPELYARTNRLKKKHVPYVYVWRKLGINLLNLRKWI